MNVLIIGGTRFLGKHLTRALLKSNQDVTLLNRGTARNVFPYYDDVEWIVCDRHDEQKVTSLLSKRSFDIVIDTCAYDLDEVSLVLRVLDDRIGRYIFCSSMAVAQNLTQQNRMVLPIKNVQFFPASSTSTYASNKSLIEEYLIEQHSKNGLPFVSIRPAEINGPGEVREWYYMDRIRNNRDKILVPGHGHNLVQPGYIDDIVQAFLLAIVKESAVGNCYNVTGDDIISLNEYIKMIADVCGREIEIVNIPYEIFKQLVNTKYFFPFCYKHSFIVDTEKIKSELGYQPEVGIKDGLRKTNLDWQDSYNRKSSPYGIHELLSYDLEDLLISVWEKVSAHTNELLRSELLDKGMLV
jgi:nucleoside-diphosphate-sugar epimerase